MRVVSWNINSVTSRLDRVREWCEANEPDVVAFQETKTVDARFPTDALAELGYESAAWGAPGGYNGVAIISRVGLDNVAIGFPGQQPAPFNEPRLIAATCGGVRIHSVYGPHGRDLDDAHYQFKLAFFERLRLHLIEVEAAADDTLIVGDFNVAPADVDVYRPERRVGRTHVSPPERAAIAALVDLGFTDMQRHLRPDETGMFTYWSYRSKLANNHGLRIDLALASHSVRDQVATVWADIAERMRSGASDHAPLVVDL